jgi:predicted nucleic acid-binding protein
VVIVVDTSVWINRLHNGSTAATRTLDAIVDPRQIAVGDIVMLEVLQGARTETLAARLERLLRRFSVVSMLNEDLALKAAGNYRALRRKGVTVRSSIDVVIGTFCIEHGHVLLHDDRDFAPMVQHLGLRLA